VDDFPVNLRPEDTGARLRAVRELAGLSPRDVARAAGLTPHEIAAAERGRRRLSTDELGALATALNVAPDVLISAGTGAMPLDAAEAGRGTTAIATDPGPHAAPSPDASRRERRRDFQTRKQVEDSWADLREQMESVIRHCMRVSTVGSGDDVSELLDSLEVAIRQLKISRSFQRELDRHERTLAAARARQ
jgi:transcriptional regulator with XRE-family HTH domain